MKSSITSIWHFSKFVCAFALSSAALQSAGAQPSDTALHALTERLATERGPRREAVVEQLAKEGVAAGPFLANLIPAKDSETRAAVTRALDRIGRRAVIVHCINSLDSPNEQVRYRAANALSMITNRHFGYSPQDTQEKRKQTIARWHKWLAEQDALPQPQP